MLMIIGRKYMIPNFEILDITNDLDSWVGDFMCHNNDNRFIEFKIIKVKETKEDKVLNSIAKINLKYITEQERLAELVEFSLT